MEENREIRVIPAVEEHRELLDQWLKILLIVQTTGFLLTALAVIPAMGTLSGWLSRAVSVCAIVAMMQLAPADERYRKAGIFMLVTLIAGIVNQIFPISILTLAVSICSLVATYQQYYAHAELVEEVNGKFAKKWRSLFVWQLVVGFAGGLITAAGVIVGVAAGMAEGTIATLTLVVTTLISAAIELVYLLYLKKTLNLVQAV